MSPWPAGLSKGSFVLALAATLPAAQVALWAWGPREAPPGIAAGASSGAAYVEARVDVAHEGDVLGRALEGSLRWLARHQHPDGMWSGRSFAQMCEGRACMGPGGDDYDVGVTALAALALLESGRVRPKYEEPVRRALAWLACRQDDDGCIGPRAGKYMYGHAIATLAFARAYPTMGGALYKHHAARGVRFLEEARNPDLAWRYGIRDGDNDTSVTGWATAALLAAASPQIGIPVDPRAFAGARRWVDQMTGEGYHEVSYARRGGGGASVRGLNEHYERNECMTAMGTWLRVQLGDPPDGLEVRDGIRRLGWNLPVWNRDGTSVDFTAWFAGARAVSACGEGPLWDAWRERLQQLLVAHQRRFNDGCVEGSWDPIDKWGAEGGRVYATATNLLTLGLVDRAR